MRGIGGEVESVWDSMKITGIEVVGIRLKHLCFDASD